MQKVAKAEPPSPEQIEAVKHFGFNAGNIPAFAPSTEVPPIQAKSTVDGVEDEYSEEADEAISEVVDSLRDKLVQLSEIRDTLLDMEMDRMQDFIKYR